VPEKALDPLMGGSTEAKERLPTAVGIFSGNGFRHPDGSKLLR
jgi:hypothetical protein